MGRIHFSKAICLSLLFVFPGVLNIEARRGEKQLPQGEEVNINIATAEEIAENVPLISLDLARRIIEYRDENGDFEFLEELLEIEGFAPTLLKKVKPFLSTEEHDQGVDDCDS